MFYFFEYRAAMYVLSTAITAMTIAIKTAAVGQSMAFSCRTVGATFEAPLRRRRYLAKPGPGRVIGPMP